MRDDEEQFEEEGEEPQEEGKAGVFCPVCGSGSVRLIEMRDETGFYECESCRLTFEEEEP